MSLLDTQAQASLDGLAKLRKRSSLDVIKMAGASLLLVLSGAAVALFLTTVSSNKLSNEEMAQLTLLVSDKAGNDPMSLWVALERSAGKPVDTLSQEEQIRAISQLLKQLEMHSDEELSVW